MNCFKCKAELPPGSIYCNQCGRKQPQAPKQRAVKSRGNGQGSVYQLPNKKWRAVRTISYFSDDDGKVHRITRSKSDFKTKREAVAFLPSLGPGGRKEPKKVTFRALYDKWLPTHRAGRSTIDCYKAAFKYFKPVWHIPMTDIDVDDLQDCLDTCGQGKRTRQNMKAVCGLVYKYGIPRGCIPENLNLAPFLIIGEGETAHRSAFTNEEIEKLRRAVGEVPYADYILCMIYTGFRPSELLSLDASAYNRKERCFVGGGKTAAGTNRIVTISPKIQDIIDRLVKDKIAGPVFCDPDGNQWTLRKFSDECFKPALKAVGIESTPDRKLTPHCCRHTFATLMKNVKGADRDKLELIGHTSEEMLRYYQDVAFDDLRRITDEI